MTKHKVVSAAAWLEARKRLLAKEKAFTRLRDELTAERRRDEADQQPHAMAWVRYRDGYAT